jgi:hypothetical protein
VLAWCGWRAVKMVVGSAGTAVAGALEKVLDTGREGVEGRASRWAQAGPRVRCRGQRAEVCRGSVVWPCNGGRVVKMVVGGAGTAVAGAREKVLGTGKEGLESGASRWAQAVCREQCRGQRAEV